MGSADLAEAFVWPFSSPWPSSSEFPVEAIPHPGVAERLASVAPRLERGSRLAVFGDQRALAGGEWQAMAGFMAIHEQAAFAEPPLLAVVDTGDIVDDGRHTDQFHMLTEILSPLAAYPYLVSIGNHEVHNNRDSAARMNTAAALARTDTLLSTDGFWRCYDLPHARLVLLDTNDLVYGPDGDGESDIESARIENQLEWLDARMSETVDRPVIVVLHHPPISSSKKHNKSAAALWSLRWHGRQLAEMFIDGGVDLVLTGHTHTYERFWLETTEGEGFHLVNLSGRPRDAVFWWGSGKRRARDWSEDTIGELRDAGWSDLDGWVIEQLDAMLDDQQNQWAVVHMTPDGKLGLEMFYLVDKGEGYRSESVVWLAQGR